MSLHWLLWDLPTAAPPVTALQPQAALEQAVLNAVRAALGYSLADSDRCFDGRPHPRAGNVWLSVWSPAGRTSDSRTSLDERFTVHVTITLRLPGSPFDRWVGVRDELERRINAVRALVHKDSWNHGIKNAANELANLGQQSDRRVGFSEALALLGTDDWQEVGGDWFHSGGKPGCGIAQTLRFGRVRLVQALAGL